MNINKPLRAAILGLLIVLAPSAVLARAIPEFVKRSVVFLSAPLPNEQSISGTGFFVSVPIPRDATQVQLYLVTSRHLVERDGKLLKSVSIRTNTLNGGLVSHEIALSADEPKTVYFHGDATVDLAVIPVVLGSGIDYADIPHQLLATGAEMDQIPVREGAEVFFTGLFSYFQGKNRNFPVTRFGRVALLTDERILFQGTYQNLYVIEIVAKGGNSGSPLFFYPGPSRDEAQVMTVGGVTLKLIGVIQAEVEDEKPLRPARGSSVPSGNTTRLVAPSNYGLALVVPAQKVLDILLSEPLATRRSRL